MRQSDEEDSAGQRLTLEALDAALKGEWEQVQACYDARADWMKDHEVSPLLAQSLLELDMQVTDRLKAAHAAIGQALSSSHTTRKQWQALSATVGDGMPVGGRINQLT